MLRGRIVIIPFLHGKLAADGSLVEPDVEGILQQWLERHPEFRGPERDFRVIRGKTHLPGGVPTQLVRVTADYSEDLAAYDPSQDIDLYQEFVAEPIGPPPSKPHKMWVEQCEAAETIDAEFGTQRALEYLVGEKFLNFLETAETNLAFREEIPAYVATIHRLFERWQLADYLERARESKPFDPKLYEPDDHPILGEEEIEYDADEIEMLKQDDIRKCTTDLLLVERAREWLLEE